MRARLRWATMTLAPPILPPAQLLVARTRRRTRSPLRIPLVLMLELPPLQVRIEETTGLVGPPHLEIVVMQFVPGGITRNPA